VNKALANDIESLRDAMMNFGLKSPEFSNFPDCSTWIESLANPTTWAGPAEYTLFAYCFEIHVLCISVLLPKVIVHSSRGKQEIMDESASDFVKKNHFVRAKLFLFGTTIAEI
jgi:hypothetical protein